MAVLITPEVAMQQEQSGGGVGGCQSIQTIINNFRTEDVVYCIVITASLSSVILIKRQCQESFASLLLHAAVAQHTYQNEPQHKEKLSW